MKKIIVFEENEFRNKLLEFGTAFFKQSLEGYGVKLISNETGKEIDDIESICGCFMMAWQETFKQT